MSKRYRVYVVLGGLCLLSVSLAGCKVDQGKEVAQYRKVLDAGAAPTTAPATSAPLTLQQALHLANASNEQLASAGEDYLQAIIAKNKAAAAFLPTVNAVPAYTVGDNGAGGTNSQTTLTASASANVFNGFQDLANLRKAGFTIEQQRELLLNQQATLLLNVVQTYYQVLRSEQQAELYRNSVQYQEERVRDTQARVRLGMAKPLDLAQSQSELAGTRVSLTQALTDARNGRSTLAYLIGLPRVDSALVDDLSVPGMPQAIDAYLSLAQAHRRDLLAAHHAVAAAEQGVKAAFGQYYPSVSVNLDYLLYHEPSTGGLWLAGISANVPIFSAGRIEADVRTAWSQYRQAGLSEANLRRQVAEEVQQAFENFRSSSTKLVDLADQVDAARQAQTLAERSYQVGNASNLDRLSAVNTLLTAELQLSSERLNQKAYYLELLRRAGQLDLSTLNHPGLPATAPAAKP